MIIQSEIYLKKVSEKIGKRLERERERDREEGGRKVDTKYQRKMEEMEIPHFDFILEATLQRHGREGMDDNIPIQYFCV